MSDELQPEETNTGSSKRRTFLKAMGATFGIGIIAATSPITEKAAADPPHKHCVSTAWKFKRMRCVCGMWVKDYVLYCRVCLDTCGTTKSELTGSPC